MTTEVAVYTMYLEVTAQMLAVGLIAKEVPFQFTALSRAWRITVSEANARVAEALLNELTYERETALQVDSIL